MPVIRTAHQMLRWTALAVLLATAGALAATPAAARDKHHKHWNYEYAYDDDEDDEDDDGGYYGYYEPPRVIYRERRYYYYEPAPTYYYPPPPVYYYPRPRYEPSFSFGVTLPIR